MSTKELSLRQLILHWLDDHVHCKQEDQQTRQDQLLSATGRAFADSLLRYEQAHPTTSDQQRGADDWLLPILRRYNKINCDEQRLNVDAELAAAFRRPK